jgi:hypothetical protein
LKTESSNSHSHLSAASLSGKGSTCPRRRGDGDFESPSCGFGWSITSLSPGFSRFLSFLTHSQFSASHRIQLHGQQQQLSTASTANTVTMSDTEQKTPNKTGASGAAWSDAEKVSTLDQVLTQLLTATQIAYLIILSEEGGNVDAKIKVRHSYPLSPPHLTSYRTPPFHSAGPSSHARSSSIASIRSTRMTLRRSRPASL